MNTSLDLEIYTERAGEPEGNFDPKRRVLETRITKLSLTETNQPYYDIGNALFDSGQYQKAIFAFKKATIIESENSFAHISRAKALFKLGRESEAFSSLKKVLSGYPDDYYVHKYLIEALEERRRLQDLESFYKEITDMITDPKETKFIYCTSAEALVHHNKYPQALINYKRVFESDSMTNYNHYNYGLALYHEGFFEEAIVQFEHVRRLNPHDKLAINNIAHLNYCLGRIQKAYEEFQYIIENRMEVLYTYSNFLLVLLHLDKEEKVISKYRDLLESSNYSSRGSLWKLYQEELRITQVILQRDDIDERTREFNTKRLTGINRMLSFLNY